MVRALLAGLVLVVGGAVTFVVLDGDAARPEGGWFAYPPGDRIVVEFFPDTDEELIETVMADLEERDMVVAVTRRSLDGLIVLVEDGTSPDERQRLMDELISTRGVTEVRLGE